MENLAVNRIELQPNILLSGDGKDFVYRDYGNTLPDIVQSHLDRFCIESPFDKKLFDFWKKDIRDMRFGSSIFQDLL